MKQEYIVGAIFGAVVVGGLAWILSSTSKKNAPSNYTPRTRKKQKER